MHNAQERIAWITAYLTVLSLVSVGTVMAAPSAAGGAPPERSAAQPSQVTADSGIFGPDFEAGAEVALQTPAQPGFQLDVVWSGLIAPTVVEFAPDGRAFVAEKSGIIKAFDSLNDPTPTVVSDLRGDVHDYWDRGLLGMTVDPAFPTRPYIYALYTLDEGNAWGDTCPNPPGATDDGCVVNGRLSRIEINPTTNTQVAEYVLLEGYWCQQYPSHSIGSVIFGGDGALYVSAGDGASFTFADYGQGGGDAGSPTPVNPCQDPDPTPLADGTPSLPDAEGGALRSQDLLTSADPVSFDGAVLRVDPDTGDALLTNPLYGGAIAADDRIIAFGMRNPFRITDRPGSNEIWVGDVGWGGFEEINVIQDPSDAIVENFGWPCYEGVGKQAGYDSLDLDLCEGLYDGSISSGLMAPFLSIAHGSPPDPTSCPGGGASISGLAFNESAYYPAAYQDALFFGDYSWRCVWVMYADASGDPDPSQIVTFVSDIGVVHLTSGPGGDLFIANINTGEIVRVTYPSGNTGPTALIVADQTSGPAPFTVQFDGSGSTDPQGDQLTYDWDLDGDGVFGDSSEVAPAHTFNDPGSYLVQLEVSDYFGATDVDTVLINVSSGGASSGLLRFDDPLHTLGQPGVGVGLETDFAHPTTSMDLRLDIDLDSLVSGRIIAAEHDDGGGNNPWYLSHEFGGVARMKAAPSTWQPPGGFWQVGRSQYRIAWSGTTVTTYKRDPADGKSLADDTGWTMLNQTTSFTDIGTVVDRVAPFVLMRRFNGLGWSAVDYYEFYYSVDGTLQSLWNGGSVVLNTTADTFVDQQGNTWTWTATDPIQIL